MKIVNKLGIVFIIIGGCIAYGLLYSVNPELANACLATILIILLILLVYWFNMNKEEELDIGQAVKFALEDNALEGVDISTSEGKQLVASVTAFYLSRVLQKSNKHFNRQTFMKSVEIRRAY